MTRFARFIQGERIVYDSKIDMGIKTGLSLGRELSSDVYFEIHYDCQELLHLHSSGRRRKYKFRKSYVSEHTHTLLSGFFLGDLTEILEHRFSRTSILEVSRNPILAK